jgi:hypothetical protein
MQKLVVFTALVLAGPSLFAASDVTQPGDPILATSDNSPGSEGVANAIDNSPTKYLNFDRLNAGFSVAPSIGETLITGLTLTSANDAPERDPASYELSGGSSLAGPWTLIASGSVPAFATRFDKEAISFANSTPYSAYKLIFPTVVGPGGNSMQISEVEFIGESTVPDAGPGIPTFAAALVGLLAIAQTSFQKRMQ